jgi:hypothetical protein
MPQQTPNQVPRIVCAQGPIQEKRWKQWKMRCLLARQKCVNRSRVDNCYSLKTQEAVLLNVDQQR